jgi:hypothetical protein
MVLEWLWVDFEMISGWFWNDFGGRADSKNSFWDLRNQMFLKKSNIWRPPGGGSLLNPPCTLNELNFALLTV